MKAILDDDELFLEGSVESKDDLKKATLITEAIGASPRRVTKARSTTWKTTPPIRLVPTSGRARSREPPGSRTRASVPVLSAKPATSPHIAPVGGPRRNWSRIHLP